MEWLRELSSSGEHEECSAEPIDAEGDLPWWTKIATQYSFGQSSVANDVVRLWAFCDWLREHQIEKLTVSDLPTYLVRTLEPWCTDQGMQFHSSNEIRDRRTRWNGLKAFAYLALHLIQYGRQKRPQQLPADFIFVDYLVGDILNSDTYSPYKSIYWQDVVKLIESSSRNVRWIHIDMFTGFGRGIRRRLRDIRRVEELSGPHVRHEVLQTWLSIPIAWRTWRRSSRLRRLASNFRKRNWWHPASGLDLSNVVLSSLTNEVCGTSGVKGALFFELFDKAFDLDQADTTLVYLMENQDWELALLRARRKHAGYSNLGYVHVCIRPWDFRYASQALMQFSPELVPSGVLATNTHDVNRLRQAGFSAARIREVEPTRFDPTKVHSQRRPAPETKLERAPVRLLILGEYDAAATDNILKLALAASDQSPWIASLEFRPHPTDIRARQSWDTRLDLRCDGTLHEALERCDAVLCSNTTTAAIQACLSGRIPFIWFWDPVLDGNVLPTHLYVPVSSVADLITGLENEVLLIKFAGGEDPLEFFHDAGHPRWKSFLHSHSG
jgi:surface carbohydrate biosynthesis protein (TIGR04326 family)